MIYLRQLTETDFIISDTDFPDTVYKFTRKGDLFRTYFNANKVAGISDDENRIKVQAAKKLFSTKFKGKRDTL